jgi:hypothetical protein
LQHIDVPFIVCWSQKSGCTSVLKWFLYHAGSLDDALQHQELNLNLKIHNYENNVLKARPGYKDDLVDQLLAGKPQAVETKPRDTSAQAARSPRTPSSHSMVFNWVLE